MDAPLPVLLCISPPSIEFYNRGPFFKHYSSFFMSQMDHFSTRTVRMKISSVHSAYTLVPLTGEIACRMKIPILLHDSPILYYTPHPLPLLWISILSQLAAFLSLPTSILAFFQNEVSVSSLVLLSYGSERQGQERTDE